MSSYFSFPFCRTPYPEEIYQRKGRHEMQEVDGQHFLLGTGNPTKPRDLISPAPRIPPRTSERVRSQKSQGLGDLGYGIAARIPNQVPSRGREGGRGTGPLRPIAINRLNDYSARRRCDTIFLHGRSDKRSRIVIWRENEFIRAVVKLRN